MNGQVLSVEGFYWYVEDNQPPRLVEYNGRRGFAMTGSDAIFRANDLPGEFFGPITFTNPNIVTTVPVTRSFSNEVIGELKVLTSELDARVEPDFCFALGFIAEHTRLDQIGKVPTERYVGPWKLQSVGLVSDEAYAKYLAQIGVK